MQCIYAIINQIGCFATSTHTPPIECPITNIRSNGECYFNTTGRWYLLAPEDIVRRLFRHQQPIPSFLESEARIVRPSGPINVDDKYYLKMNQG